MRKRVKPYNAMLMLLLTLMCLGGCKEKTPPSFKMADTPVTETHRAKIAVLTIDEEAPAIKNTFSDEVDPMHFLRDKREGIKEEKPTEKTEEKETAEKKEEEPPAPTLPIPKKSVEEMAQEVVNGKHGNGAERQRRLEALGYVYQEVQEAVNQLAPAPEVHIVAEATRVDEEETAPAPDPTPAATIMEPYSLLIGGVYFPITNNASQERIDQKNQEFVNWSALYDEGSGEITSKTHGNGRNLYLTAHMRPWGDYPFHHNTLEFADRDGTIRTYVLEGIYGTYEDGTLPDIVIRSATGVNGDGLVFQTCVDAAFNYKVAVFRLQ